MTLLYNHLWALEIDDGQGDGRRYENLDMRFTSRMANTSKATTCDITVFSPDPYILGSLGKPGTLIRMLAGYETTGASVVGFGTVVKGTVEDRSASPDPYVSFQLTSGKQVFSQTTVSRSWSNITAEEVLRYLAGEMGLALEVFELATNPRYQRGYTVSGSASAAFAVVARDCGCQFTTVDGALRVWPVGRTARVTADVWSEDTGLLEALGPADGSSIRAVALLRPALRPGDIIKLDDRAYVGEVIAQEIVHEGDTYSDKWYTSIVGIPRR